MPYRNRVDPFGHLLAVAARGLFTGNRGAIHDPDTRAPSGRRWTTRAWIVCDCGYRGRKRDVMGHNAPGGGAGWTNLFFLDEVTALAAGHRPCFLCRRAAAEEFCAGFTRAFGGRMPRAATIDARLHAERNLSGAGPLPLAAHAIVDLPDGAMVADADDAFALRGGRALRWHAEGYGDGLPLAAMAWRAPRLLTPPTTVGVLRAGFRPVWAASAAVAASSTKE